MKRGKKEGPPPTDCAANSEGKTRILSSIWGFEGGKKGGILREMYTHHSRRRGVERWSEGKEVGVVLAEGTGRAQRRQDVRAKNKLYEERRKQHAAAAAAVVDGGLHFFEPQHVAS